VSDNRISVYHENLLPIAACYYESRCPFCEKGVFKATRNPGTQQLEEDDVCTVCGQKIRYADIVRVRDRDPFQTKTEKQND